MSGFVHLHNYTDYSLQKSTCTVDSLIKAAIEAKQTAIAITDFGVMYGVPEFYRKTKSAGIKPIIGCNINFVANRTNNISPESVGRLVLLVKNDVGYKNLVKLVSINSTEKDKISMDILSKYRDGLIVLSSGLDGIIAHQFSNGKPNRAREIAIEFKKLFSNDFYLEIQEHGKKEDEPFRMDIPQLAKELDIKLVATNSIHYIKRQDAIAHNVLLNISGKRGNNNSKNLIYGTDQFYFRSSEKMKSLFQKYPEAITNTLDIANKIDDTITFDKPNAPVFQIPKDSTTTNLDEYLNIIAKKGLEKRYKGREITQEIWNRLNHEIKVIVDLGYTDYFLVIQDYVNAVKNDGIPVGPGRGKVPSSLVAYALRITDINPLDYDLVFEQFLNVEEGYLHYIESVSKL